MIVLVGPRSRTEVFTCSTEVDVVDYKSGVENREDDEDVAEGDGEADEPQRHQRPGHLPNSEVQSGRALGVTTRGEIIKGQAAASLHISPNHTYDVSSSSLLVHASAMASKHYAKKSNSCTVNISTRW